jgi:hypothetical protein
MAPMRGLIRRDKLPAPMWYQLHGKEEIYSARNPRVSEKQVFVLRPFVRL